MGNSLNIDLTGKIVRLRPVAHKAGYRKPHELLCLAMGGFGASPQTSGSSLSVHYLSDGAQGSMSGYDVAEIVDQEQAYAEMKAVHPYTVVYSKDDIKPGEQAKVIAFFPNEEAASEYIGRQREAATGRYNIDGPEEEMAEEGTEEEAQVSVQILHYRDPDGGCDHDVWVNGVKVTARVDVTDIDPGRGWQRADWDQRIAEARLDTSDYGQTVLQALLDSESSSFIED